VNLADINARLIQLYAEIAAHSQVMCCGAHPQGCRVPHSCCDRSVCLLVIEEAKWNWNTVLLQTDHPKYPLMKADGSCSAPPHMRPLCSVHVCCISSFGRHPTDNAWTARYWLLRNEIEELEATKFGRKEDGDGNPEGGD